MMIILRNLLAVIIGVVVGGGVNMAIVIVGSGLIPAPAGVDLTDAESIRASIHLFEVKHFITPFLAHAAGTLVGSLAAFIVAASYQTLISYGIGTVFLVGGIAASFMIPAPVWFIVLDLVAAYVPMAWVGICLGRVFKRKNAIDST